MIFSKILIFWYKKNKRELPWRNTKKPYFIWLSEIMLQQTRVAQGMSYYLKFTEGYPTVSDLANASETEVLKMWHSEQTQEYYSDSLGFELASKVGYDWTSGLSGFYEYLSVDTILNELEKKGNIFKLNLDLFMIKLV